MRIGGKYRPENPLMFFWRRCPLMIFLAILQHFTWAALLLMDERVETVTALAALTPLIIIYRGVVLLIFVAIMAAASIFVIDTKWRTIMMLPQQFVLGVCAMGAIEAMVKSRFADGIAHPRTFIIADQLPAVLIAIFHTVAIFRSIKEKHWEL